MLSAMNILFLYRIYPSYGGVEVITSLLANEFIKDGHKVTIASFERGNTGLLKQLNSDVKMLELDRRIFCLSNIKQFRSWCKEQKIDIVINQWGLPFYTSLFVKISAPTVPLISVLHGSPVVAKTLLQTEAQIKFEKYYFKKLFYKALLIFKRKVIKYGLLYNLSVNKTYVLLSKAFIPVFEKFTGKKNIENLIAIGNPITIYTDYSMHQFEKKHNILYVGRMDYPNKRVDRVIDFWERNCEKLHDWTLTMVGDGPYKPKVEEKAKKLPRITLAPFQEDPPVEYYKESDVLLLTSDLEGFGLVVIEAMSYGLVPVVYGSYEAIYDIIDDGKCGIIIPKPFDNDSFDMAVRDICNDDSKRMKFSKEAVIKSRIFSITEIKKKWYLVINNAIN